MKNVSKLCIDVSLHRCIVVSMYRCSVMTIMYRFMYRILLKIMYQKKWREIQNYICSFVIFVDTLGTYNFYSIGTNFQKWPFQINPSFLNTCWVINRINMSLLKNHKAMTLIYRRNQGDNFLVFFSSLSQIRTKRVHIRRSHLIPFLKGFTG
jgi:hypothetical protein